MKRLNTFLASLLLIPGVFGPPTTFAQDHSPAPEETKIIVAPDSLSLQVDEETQLTAEIQSSEDIPAQSRVLFYSRDRRSVSVTPDGVVRAHEPGSYTIVAVLARSANEDRQVTTTVPVHVAAPAIEEVTFVNTPEHIYTETRIPLRVEVYDKMGERREDTGVTFQSSNTDVAEIDTHDQLTGRSAGEVTITAEAGDVTTEWTTRVISNPVTELQLTVDRENVRTGDVVHLESVPRTNDGTKVSDIPVTYALTAFPEDTFGPPAPAQISQDGRFVANEPGRYLLTARVGSTVAEKTVSVAPRELDGDLEVVGHGAVLDVHTSDLWVWEGIDGRDYAVTGTWGARGEAYFWDVTDPSAMHRIDTVQVDARTVNDVKISEDGTLCVITREGASDRRNGIVILDVSDLSNVTTISTFDDGLTGGVHNVFIYEDHVYAINNGTRYDIINIEDPKNPHRVARYELDTPGHAVHDVWVEDGLAYSSNGEDGIHVVDAGNGIAGGSPENPVTVGTHVYPNGWNHAAFPFHSESTDKFFVVAGDEAFPRGIHVRDQPTIPAGWIHFIDFSDWENPEEVARYRIPEAGSHNFWVKGDTLYVAYYNAGLRVVDISGDLMGNLYDQGREIARFIPTRPEAVVPNAAMTWGPQPYKGLIFLSDWNSGLWAVRLKSSE
jgi:hypothetical protein